jgi:hypothetical protein
LDIPSIISAECQIDQFLLELNSLEQQATTFNERLQLWREKEGLKHDPSCSLSGLFGSK